jgi:pimeloyl-ACP methyl ester carboxylesterase
MVPKGRRDFCRTRCTQSAAILDRRKRHRFLRRGVQAQRLPRRAQLLPQHRSQLGNHRRDGRPAGVCAGALHRRRSRLRGRLPGYGPVARKHEELRPRLAQDPDAPGCGHWTQQERPNEVSAALVEFIQALPSRP